VTLIGKKKKKKKQKTKKIFEEQRRRKLGGGAFGKEVEEQKPSRKRNTSNCSLNLEMGGGPWSRTEEPVHSFGLQTKAEFWKPLADGSNYLKKKKKTSWSYLGGRNRGRPKYCEKTDTAQ